MTGPAGANGETPVSSPEPAGTNCPTGGVKYTTSLGSSYVCNGPTGPQGPQGVQGPAGVAGADGTNGGVTKSGCGAAPSGQPAIFLLLSALALGTRRRRTS